MTQGTVAPRQASAPTVAKQGRSIAISDDSVATSVALLNRDGKLWIEHGGERYLLRRTANNRLILTK
ncbi:MAG: hemin uptake protein HemP [Alcanivorax sp.]|jgi:hemin uptake protein HemP|uniref:Hemin uptake protein n=1 Tax=Alloalcanivorax venustensis ISO4 TaxID=1177184 RepID=A0ABS0ADB1_9GAMM|nr:hemin uptake protein HemP [Alloalcanivorax venustensis]MAK21728.1 hemin transporter [Alcanivorax sp.]MEA3261806.1 hemin uptake protein HemP [Pseudomonadota bacterium]SMO73833.1 Hemin uptake protein HemP [Alcanivorax sp. DSM 26295]MAQ32599.1 hemin transporter [Alcanivorax sp.]MBA4731114.1 hemin uptake protein HemP [Alcanivorax sp.]|tara:strand:- start:14702 stop:14902 length:201 start_codon:yes stop_codon:yes gene_type:complete